MRTRRLLAVMAFAMWSCGSIAGSEFCELVEGNFLQDPTFSQRNPGGVLEYWGSTQHAGEPSFDVGFDNGELAINKTGTQPWFYFRQNVAAQELAGKKLALTAQLKFDLRPPKKPQAIKVGGGIMMVARSSSLQGRKLLLRSVLDHQPSVGKTDWHPVQVVVLLPAGTDRVDVGFLHQADGTLQVRDASFQLVDESSRPCAVSPNAILGVPRVSSGLR